MKSLFEQLGGAYTRQGDYCLPNVCLPPEEERSIGVYGQRRRAYLKEHHRVLYYKPADRRGRWTDTLQTSRSKRRNSFFGW